MKDKPLPGCQMLVVSDPEKIDRILNASRSWSEKAGKTSAYISREAAKQQAVQVHVCLLRN